VSNPTCDRAVLVEAMFDARLGPTERASIERHLKNCTSCAELLRDLTSLREMLRSSAPVSSLDHQRARLALLRQTAAPFATKRRPVALLVAALVTLPLAVWASTSSLSFLRVRDVVLAPTTPPAAKTSAIARKQVANEPAPTSAPASSAWIEDTSAAPTPATNAAPSTLPLEPPSTPLRALPGLSSSARPVPRKARGVTGEKPETATSSVAASAAPASQASQDFADAMKALARGDFTACAGKLEGFVAAHPRDSRVEEAVYLDAIALERAGRLSDAKAAARRYLEAYPGGVHRAQARRIAGD
jgi:TolA-binding protein